MWKVGWPAKMLTINTIDLPPGMKQSRKRKKMILKNEEKRQKRSKACQQSCPPS